MSFSQLWSVIKARRMSALIVFALIVIAVAVWSLTTLKQYTATASVIVDLRSPDPVAAPNSSSNVQAGYMATQIDLIQTERVALRAIKALKLDEDPAQKAYWQEVTKGNGDFEAWLAESVTKKLDVKPSRESSILNVSFTSTDPKFSAAMANAVVRAYIDTTLDLKTEPAKQYNNFFDDRAKALRANLEESQRRLSAYQQAKGIVATDERVDVENSRLSELSSQVVSLQAAADESAGRQRAGSSDSPEVLSNMLIGNIASDLSRQEARLREVRERLGDRHPDVVELTANVAQLRQRLATETRRISGSLSINNSVDRSRLVQAQAALAEQRNKVLRLRGQRDEASVLLRDVDSAQKAYDSALARSSQSNLESQNTLTNVSVVKTATPPAFASSPRVLLNIAVAIVGGGLLAIVFALLREMTDRRMRFESDVMEGLGSPMLVSMPGRDSQVSRNPVHIGQSIAPRKLTSSLSRAST